MARSPLDVKWVYKIKVNSQGKVDRHKVSYVVEGYKQKNGVDYVVHLYSCYLFFL